MADKEPFSEKVTVAEKAEKVGNAGMYYALKNEKGLVFNVNEKVVAQCGGIRVGDTLFMEGVILPPKPGSTYTKGSRWVNSYTKAGAAPPTLTPASVPTPAMNTPKSGYSVIPSPIPTYEGWRIGQALNMAITQMAGDAFPFDDPAYFPTLHYRADKFLKANMEYEKNAGKHKDPHGVSEEDIPF